MKWTDCPTVPVVDDAGICVGFGSRDLGGVEGTFDFIPRTITRLEIVTSGGRLRIPRVLHELDRNPHIGNRTRTAVIAGSMKEAPLSAIGEQFVITPGAHVLTDCDIARQLLNRLRERSCRQVSQRVVGRFAGIELQIPPMPGNDVQLLLRGRTQQESKAELDLNRNAAVNIPGMGDAVAVTRS